MSTRGNCMARVPLSSNKLDKDFIKFSWSGIRCMDALEKTISNFPREDKSSVTSCKINLVSSYRLLAFSIFLF